jgi:dihydroorotate dehydrogenase (fumarate)
MTPSLETTVAGIRLETCVYNASGPRTGSSAALAKITASESGAVLSKSATVNAQTGNPQPRTWHDTDTNGASLNSEGLPNSGIDYYLDAKTIEEAMGSSMKPYMVSISGNTLEDNLKMLQQILKSPQKIAAIELNLACPNIIGKPIIGYDFDQMKNVLEQVSKVKNILKVPLGVKLPPYFDGPHFQQAATILNNYSNVVKYVASINTIGNALAVDAISEAPVISAKGGFAGLSGRAVKYTALSNVRQMRSLLDDKIDVVGVGGIETGTDAFEMILCGAHAVQVGTCHWKEGPKCLDRICAELRELMASKGYNSIEDFRGKLKPWSKEGAALSRATRKNDPSGEIRATAAKSTGDPFTMISAILTVLVAILLADKFGLVNIG